MGWFGPHELYQWGDDNSQELASGIIKKGETLEELAEAFGFVGVAEFAEEVARYNGFVDAGRDEDSVMIATVTALGIIALVAFIVSIALKEVSFNGTAAKVTNIVSDVLRIIAPALLFIVMLTFVYGSFTGLGWTFFSNEELEIYPKAISTGKTVITGAVFFLLAAISGTVASFFEITRKQA